MVINPGLVLDLVERVAALPRGGTVTLPLHGDGDDTSDRMLVTAWCERTGNHVVGFGTGTVTVRRGRPRDPFADLPRDQVPGARLWMYTNFDCNLSCDYCLTSSSPRAPRRALGAERVRRLAREAADAGVREIVLTGGEPFLLPDLDVLVADCTAAAPTTLLTNAMLLRGQRLQMLRRMDRGRLVLQVSLDSAEPGLHDRHRGARAWERAVAGILTAQQEGFRVKVAATVDPHAVAETEALRAYFDSLGIDRVDQVVRAVARRGVAERGVLLTIETLIPEVTVTADGVYWHPVGADHADQFVTGQLFPLADAIAEVRRRFAQIAARAEEAAQWFPCA